jgi:hypothetical protein
MESKELMERAMMAIVFAAVMLSALSVQAQAATYFSMLPGDEKCTQIYLGDNGRGEYTMTVTDPGEAEEKPWVDIHFTSLLARPENRITVPICFSTIGRRVGESAVITADIDGPDSDFTKEYGICVSNDEDVDFIEGSPTNPCQEMAEHTDVFSASFNQPEQYAEPGEDVLFTLTLDSSVAATVDIGRSSGDMDISASQTTAELGSGPQEIELWLTAPSSAGDYPFSVLVEAQDCSLDDCRREVTGIIHVTETGKDPEGRFFLWLTGPESINGVENADYVIEVRNYGPGQKITIAASAGEGLTTDFAPYTAYIETDASKKIPLTVVPTTDESKSYKIKASATGEDGERVSAEAWLTVNEMVSDAKKLGDESLGEKYSREGTVTLEDLKQVKSTSSSPDTGDDFDDLNPTPEGPDMTFYMMIAAVVAIIAVLGFFLYKRMGSSNGQAGGWNQLTQQ